jgi:hypothetical protein
MTDTRKPLAAVTRSRFVGDDGLNLAVAGARALGVAQDTLTATDITNKETLTITLDGIEELEINASINANTFTKIASDALGRGVAAVAGDAINAISLNVENAVAGDRIPVLLVHGVDAAAATSGATLAALETEVNNLKTLIEKLIAF